MLCASISYAREFPEGLKNTKWRQTRLRSRRNYDIYEFSDQFFIVKQYKNDELINSSTHKIIGYQKVKGVLVFWYKDETDGNIYENRYDLNDHVIEGEVLAIWYEEIAGPSIYELRYDLKAYGGAALLRYFLATKYRKSYIQYFTPLVE